VIIGRHGIRVVVVGVVLRQWIQMAPVFTSEEKLPFTYAPTKFVARTNVVNRLDGVLADVATSIR